MNEQPANNEIVDFDEYEEEMREHIDDMDMALDVILWKGRIFKEDLEYVQREQNPKKFYRKTKKLYNATYNIIESNKNLNEKVQRFRSVFEQKYSEENDNE